MHRALHISRVVIVQPSVYGTDNSCTLDAMKQYGSAARGIAVLPSAISSTTLDNMERAVRQLLICSFVVPGLCSATAQSGEPKLDDSTAMQASKNSIR